MDGGLKFERNYGIDLLRIIAMFMICLLHLLGEGGVIQNISNQSQQIVFGFIEVICCCSVDVFGLISGYVSSKQNNKVIVKKIIKMWFQIIFYSLFLTIILSFVLHGSLPSVVELVKSIFPITSRRYWYFSAYFILLCIRPFLDYYLEDITITTSRKLLFVFAVLLPMMDAINSPFGFEDGYNGFWIIMLYIIGALINKSEITQLMNSNILVIIYLLNLSLSYVLHTNFGLNTLSYTSVINLVNSIILLLFFSKINQPTSFVKKISPLTFGIYLFQNNKIFYYDILSGSATKVLNASVIVGCTQLIVLAISIFIAGSFVEKVRKMLFSKLKINNYINIVIDKIITIYFDSDY